MQETANFENHEFIIMCLVVFVFPVVTVALYNKTINKSIRLS